MTTLQNMNKITTTKWGPMPTKRPLCQAHTHTSRAAHSRHWCVFLRGFKVTMSTCL